MVRSELYPRLDSGLRFHDSSARLSPSPCLSTVPFLPLSAISVLYTDAVIGFPSYAILGPLLYIWFFPQDNFDLIPVRPHLALGQALNQVSLIFLHGELWRS